MGVLDVKKVLVARFYNDEELQETVIYKNVSEKEIEKEVDLIARDYDDHSITEHNGYYCFECNNTDSFHADSVSRGVALMDGNGDFLDWINDGTERPKFTNFICSKCKEPAICVDNI